MFAGTVVVMGVSGTGKTEVAARLAAELGRAFIEADRLHGPPTLRRWQAAPVLRTPTAGLARGRSRCGLAEPGPTIVACFGAPAGL